MYYGKCLSGEHLFYSAALKTESMVNAKFWGVNKVHYGLGENGQYW